MIFYISLFSLLFSVQSGSLRVVATDDHDVFNVLYQGDLKWHIEVTLLDEKGRKRFTKKYDNQESLALAIDMSQEKSGTYTVQVSTAAYDLKEEFVYLKYSEKVEENIVIEYVPEKHVVHVSTVEALTKPFSIYIYNEGGDELISDDAQPTGGLTLRSYNLDGAPARQLEVIIMMDGGQIKRETFPF